MPSDKRNSITTKAISLISSLFNVASSQDVPFCQPLQIQCSYHGSTKAYLCSPFLSPLLRRWQFVVAPLRGFTEDLVNAVIAEVFNTLSFCLYCFRNCYTTLKTKCNRPKVNRPFTDPGACAVRSGFPYFHMVARRDTFHPLLCL